MHSCSSNHEQEQSEGRRVCASIFVERLQHEDLCTFLLYQIQNNGQTQVKAKSYPQSRPKKIGEQLKSLIIKIKLFVGAIRYDTLSAITLGIIVECVIRLDRCVQNL